MKTGDSGKVRLSKRKRNQEREKLSTTASKPKGPMNLKIK